MCGIGSKVLIGLLYISFLASCRFVRDDGQGIMGFVPILAGVVLRAFDEGIEFVLA